jgi:glycosyltransferase involved in cell wall biosynthesis
MARTGSVSSRQNAVARTPLISVILPVYNGDPYLVEAVRSIQNQTLADFELLAIDDGSTDASAPYLRQAARQDSRISVIPNPNRGLVGALNLGLKLARGEFIARVDADDVSSATRFERQIGFLKASPPIAVVGSAVTLINSAGGAIGTMEYPTEPVQVHAALERMDCAVAHGSVMARRTVITSVGGYREAFRHAEDYDLWLRVTEQHHIGNLTECLMCYRCHGESVSVRHRYEQRLATHIAYLCARERRSGRPDPMVGSCNLSLADLLRFNIEESQRAMIVRSMLEDCRRRPKTQHGKLRGLLGTLMETIIHQWRTGRPRHGSS